MLPLGCLGGVGTLDLCENRCVLFLRAISGSRSFLVMNLGSSNTEILFLLALRRESSIGDVRDPNVYHPLVGKVPVLEGAEEVAVWLCASVLRLDFDEDSPIENAERLALDNRLNIYESQLKLGLREHVSAEADVLLCKINVAYSLD